VLTKLLIVDVDLTLTETLKRFLELKRFEVRVANTGSDAIEVARRWGPDVISLDLMMPGIDGWQVTAAIRAFSQAPILIYSAVINPDLVERALDEGANDYLVKPAPPGVVASRLQRLARYSRANSVDDHPGTSAGTTSL
jgi:DNA-binding response OmpR family regulator